jgi:hypothetical protein
MLKIIAEKQFGREFSGISITQDGKNIFLSAEESATLINVLTGKEGVISIRKEGEYQAERTIFCSCGGERFRCEVEDFPALKDLTKSENSAN